MTTDLEKQFFNTFGIEPIGCNDNKNCTGTLDCRTQCPNAKYPQITSDILLELICILAKWHLNLYTHYKITGYNLETLKTQVLEECISYQLSEKFKSQVQALFKENSNDN